MIRLTAIKVSLHFKSGRTVRFVADRVVRRDPGNNLGFLEAAHAPHYPLYLRLNEIEAITTRRVLCVRWLP